MKHDIKHLHVDDIDGSAIWHYSSCACGHETPCVATREMDDANVAEHLREVEMRALGVVPIIDAKGLR